MEYGKGTSEYKRGNIQMGNYFILDIAAWQKTLCKLSLWAEFDLDNVMIIIFGSNLARHKPTPFNLENVLIHCHHIEKSVVLTKGRIIYQTNLIYSSICQLLPAAQCSGTQKEEQILCYNLSEESSLHR